MSKKKQTPQQLLLGIHLKELSIETVPEYVFATGRKFAFDLYLPKFRIGLEVDGFHKGGHGGGWGKDYEKDRLAQILGFKILRFSNREVENGDAKDFLAQWLQPIAPDPRCDR